MTKFSRSIGSIGIVALAATVVSCSGNQDGFTKAQEDAIRHPQKDANWKKPTQADFDQENQAIKAWKEKHSNQQVQLATGQ